MQPAIDLPDNYYLDNFIRLVSHCQHHYGDLLPYSVHAQLQAFQRCDSRSQQLFVRLICRKGPLFRADKLDYPEIGPLQAAARELAEQQLLTINPALSLESFCSLLTVPELRKQFQLPSGKRDVLLSQLYQRHPTDTSYREVLATAPFQIWQLNAGDLIQQLTLLYFGNLYQDIREFVLSDLGVQRYESYPLNRHHRVFQSWAQVEQLLRLHQLCSAPTESLTLPDSEQLADLLPTAPVLHGHSRRLNELGRQLERAGRNEDALHCYRLSQLPPARERRARILATSDTAAALALCQQIQQQPVDVSEQEFCASFIPRLERQLGGPPVRRSKADWPELQLTLPNNGARVEQQVLAHFQHHGWRGAWCENDLLCGLFGLLCWEIIFADIPGAFNQPFQRGPLDLNSPDFGQRRRALFEQRFEQLRRGDPVQQLSQCWQQKEGLQNPFVSWKRLSLPLLTAAAERIPRETLLALLHQLAFDSHHYRSGLPDLFLWRDDEYLLIEVKGPGDTLQASQKRWLKLFQQLQLPHQICYVQWQDEKENEP